LATLVIERRLIRLRGLRFVPVVAAATAIALQGCASSGADRGGSTAHHAAQEQARRTQSTPPSSASPSPSLSDAPATTSGPLTGETLPSPQVLGPQWATAEERAIASDEAQGNGTWTQERDPQGVIDGLTPIGCAALAGPLSLPRPTHALQGTYTANGRGAVSLALEFGDPSKATAFFDQLTGVLSSCPRPADVTSVTYGLAVDVLERTPTVFVARQSEFGTQASSDSYGEIYVMHGARVGVLFQQGPPGGPGPDLSGTADGLSSALAN
jgi:hypothetical protein